MVIAYEMVKRGFDRAARKASKKVSPKRAYAKVNKELAEYHKRMQEARERGEEFNELPPMFER